MPTVEVYDPPMCCSTGVCGPTVDPALATFAADLAWLADQGATVKRYNLSQEPKAFAENEKVRALLADQPDSALPAVLVDGSLLAAGRYPSRDELASWSLVGSPTTGARPQDRGAATGACCGGAPAGEVVLVGAAAAPTSRGCCG